MTRHEPTAEEWDRHITGGWEGNPNWERDSNPEYQAMKREAESLRYMDALYALDMAEYFRHHWEYSSSGWGNVCVTCGDDLPPAAENEQNDPDYDPYNGRDCAACIADRAAGRITAGYTFSKYANCDVCGVFVLLPREARFNPGVVWCSEHEHSGHD